MRRLKGLMLKTFGPPLCAVVLSASGCGAPEEASAELGVPTARDELSALAVKKVMPLGDSITQAAAGGGDFA